MNPINPEAVAEKLQFWRENKPSPFHATVKDATLIELMWFIQAISRKSGGVDALAKELIEKFADRFVTNEMKSAVASKARYTVDQCVEVWRGFSARVEKQNRWGDGAPTENDNLKPTPHNFISWVRNVKYHSRSCLEEGSQVFNFQFLKAVCHEAALAMLADNLKQLCGDPSWGFSSPWYCPDLVELLVEQMQSFAFRERASIAQTEVSRIVYRELDFASFSNVPVPIVGESRIGKTSPAVTWCAARPGRARLVTVPESNSMRAFMEAHADAFGIEYSPKTTITELTSAVKFVHRHSGLFICYDEAQFLVPTKYTKATPPARIDYVRCQVIDRDLSCAFLATPQSYNQTLDQYVKTTGNRIEQWLGRIFRTVILPSDLGREDLLAVARLNFPDMPEPFLKLIASKAMRSEGYIKNMEFTAKRARFIAYERGHEQPTIEDVETAIIETDPGPATAPAPQPRRDTIAATPQPRSRDAAKNLGELRRPESEPFPRTSSLHTVAPQRAETGLATES